MELLIISIIAILIVYAVGFDLPGEDMRLAIQTVVMKYAPPTVISPKRCTMRTLQPLLPEEGRRAQDRPSLMGLAGEYQRPVDRWLLRAAG